MFRYFAILSVLLLTTLAICAQSGRRVTATPTPTPIPPDPTTLYSESKPQLPRRTSPTGFSKLGGAPINKDSKLEQPETVRDDDVVKVETNFVTIPVSVFDRNGLYIPGLTQDDFKIFEDGKEQEIAYFGTTEKPFTVILLLDTSPSAAYKIEEIQAAARSFVDQLKPQDSVMVIEFAGTVHVLTESTNDREKIYTAIKRADWGDGTSLYDAVDFSLRKRLSKIEGRKAIVLFTDGVDTTSGKSNYDKTIDMAEESDSLIFPIYYNTYGQNLRTSPFPGGGGMNTRGTSPGDYALGRHYLDELAAYTGGRVFRPDSTPGGLTAAFEGIAEELRRQYTIGYIPNGEGSPGQRKHIKVRVDRPNLVLRARDSYIVN